MPIFITFGCPKNEGFLYPWISRLFWDTLRHPRNILLVIMPKLFVPLRRYLILGRALFTENITCICVKIFKWFMGPKPGRIVECFGLPQRSAFLARYAATANIPSIVLIFVTFLLLIGLYHNGFLAQKLVLKNSCFFKECKKTFVKKGARIFSSCKCALMNSTDFDKRNGKNKPIPCP